MHLARRQVQRLAGVEGDPVEHERRDRARVAGVLLGEAHDGGVRARRRRPRREAFPHGVDGGLDVGAAVGVVPCLDQVREGRADPVGGAVGPQGITDRVHEDAAQPVEQVEHRARRAEAGEAVELGERDDHLGLVLVVVEGPARVAGRQAEPVLPVEPRPGEVRPRVHLQRQRPVGGEHLEQVRQAGAEPVGHPGPQGGDRLGPHEVGEGAAGVGVRAADVRRRARVGAEPQLGGRAAVGLVTEQLGDEGGRAPVVGADGVPHP